MSSKTISDVGPGSARSKGGAKPGMTGQRPQWRARERAAFVVEMLGGTRATARVLDVAPSQPSRWASGEAVPDQDHARVLLDLDHILALAVQVWAPEVARDWLVTGNGHLDDARPIDVLRRHGAADVAVALRAEAAGAYA